MGEQKNNNWYDMAFTEMPQYQVGYKSIGYYAMWKNILTKVSKKDKIVELGCGVGQFAHMMYDNGYNYICGYDFSEVAIAKAKERCNLTFHVRDLLKEDINAITIDSDVVIICEFLEHIENDIDLIKNIKKRMIITLPNFDGTSHVRHFKTKQDVLNRYSDIVDIEELEESGNHYILICTVK